MGCGFSTSYAVLYCNQCKNFYSVLVSFNEENIRRGRLKAEEAIKEINAKLIKPAGEYYMYELGKIVKIYPCPKCGQLANELDENLIIGVVARRASEGKLEIGSCLLCPKCKQKTLYFDHTFKYD